MEILAVTAFVLCLAWLPNGYAQTVLFEDTFDGALSDKWQIIGLDREDYRVRDGALELRVTPDPKKQPQPMLKVDLPFTTAETVEASVEVTMVGEQLQRGESAGLCLTDKDGAVFTARKTNIDGYFVLCQERSNSSASRARKVTPASTRSSTGQPTHLPVRSESSCVATMRTFRSVLQRMASRRRSFTLRFARAIRDWDSP